MIRISVLGNKGGSGKTLLSHVICYGLGACGVPSYHFTTDQNRKILSQEGRYYAILDGRDPGALRRLLESLASRHGVAVIDGAANNVDADARLAGLSNMVLVPFQASAEDLRVAGEDMRRLPAALGVPMRWPTNPWQRISADRLLGRHLGGDRSRIAGPVVTRNALVTLLGEDRPDPRIGAICRAVVVDLLHRSGFNIEKVEG